MAQQCRDFTLYQNDDVTIQVTIRDENGDLVDVSGASAAQWIMRKYAGSTTASITKTLAAAEIDVATSGASGIITIDILSADTTSLSPGEYYHELRITDAAGGDSTILVGHVNLKPTIAI
jgi:hypothetical protein